MPATPGKWQARRQLPLERGGRSGIEKTSKTSEYPMEYAEGSKSEELAKGRRTKRDLAWMSFLGAKKRRKKGVAGLKRDPFAPLRHFHAYSQTFRLFGTQKVLRIPTFAPRFWPPGQLNKSIYSTNKQLTTFGWQILNRT